MCSLNWREFVIKVGEFHSSQVKYHQEMARYYLSLKSLTFEEQVYEFRDIKWVPSNINLWINDCFDDHIYYMKICARMIKSTSDNPHYDWRQEMLDWFKSTLDCYQKRRRDFLKIVRHTPIEEGRRYKCKYFVKEYLLKPLQQYINIYEVYINACYFFMAPSLRVLRNYTVELADVGVINFDKCIEALELINPELIPQLQSRYEEIKASEQPVKKLISAIPKKPIKNHINAKVSNTTIPDSVTYSDMYDTTGSSAQEPITDINITNPEDLKKKVSESSFIEENCKESNPIILTTAISQDMCDTTASHAVHVTASVDLKTKELDLLSSLKNIFNLSNKLTDILGKILSYERNIYWSDLEKLCTSKKGFAGSIIDNRGGSLRVIKLHNPVNNNQVSIHLHYPHKKGNKRLYCDLIKYFKIKLESLV